MFIKFGIDKLLRERHLGSTLTHVYPYNQNVVREFYANLSIACGLPNSPRFGKVFVQGALYTFNPEVINDVFSLPYVDIPNWSMEGKVEKARIPSTKLTCKYDVLHKVVVACWMWSKRTQVLTKDQTIMIYRGPAFQLWSIFF